MRKYLFNSLDAFDWKNRSRKEIALLLYRHGCFTGKYTREIHAQLHPGPEWRIFHILTSEDIDDVIFRFFTTVCVWLVVCLYTIKRTLHVRSKMWIWAELNKKFTKRGITSWEFRFGIRKLQLRPEDGKYWKGDRRRRTKNFSAKLANCISPMDMDITRQGRDYKTHDKYISLIV